MSDMHIRHLESRIEELQDSFTQLEEQYASLQNLMCFMVNKFGNPVIITEHDLVEMPNTGTLAVHTDPATGSVMITFAEETTLDSNLGETQSPQGDGQTDGSEE